MYACVCTNLHHLSTDAGFEDCSNWGLNSSPHTPGAVARAEANSLGMQAAPSSIPTSGTFFPGHENISTAILPLPLIQEEQLSVTGERMCTKYW